MYLLHLGLLICSGKWAHSITKATLLLYLCFLKPSVFLILSTYHCPPAPCVQTLPLPSSQKGTYQEGSLNPTPVWKMTRAKPKAHGSNSGIGERCRPSSILLQEQRRWKQELGLAGLCATLQQGREDVVTHTSATHPAPTPQRGLHTGLMQVRPAVTFE